MSKCPCCNQPVPDVHYFSCFASAGTPWFSLKARTLEGVKRETSKKYPDREREIKIGRGVYKDAKLTQIHIVASRSKYGWVTHAAH